MLNFSRNSELPFVIAGSKGTKLCYGIPQPQETHFHTVGFFLPSTLLGTSDHPVCKVPGHGGTTAETYNIYTYSLSVRKLMRLHVLIQLSQHVVHTFAGCDTPGIVSHSCADTFIQVITAHIIDMQAWAINCFVIC